MHKDYTVAVSLWFVGINKDVVTHILKSGAKLGFIYRDRYAPGRTNTDAKVVSYEHVAEKLLEYQTGGVYIEVVYQDIVFFLRIYNNEGIEHLVRMSHFAPGWTKKFSDGREAVDLARHLKLLLTLCDDMALGRVEARFE